MSKIISQLVISLSSGALSRQQFMMILSNKLLFKGKQNCGAQYFSKVSAEIISRHLKNIKKILGVKWVGDNQRISVRRLQIKLNSYQALKAQPLASLNNNLFFQVGDLHIDIIARRVELAGEELFLTATEFEILHQLVAHAGLILSSETLTQNTTGIIYDGQERSMDKNIRALREKLNDNPTSPQRIKTIHSKRYLLVTNAFE